MKLLKNILFWTIALLAPGGFLLFAYRFYKNPRFRKFIVDTLNKRFTFSKNSRHIPPGGNDDVNNGRVSNKLSHM